MEKLEEQVKNIALKLDSFESRLGQRQLLMDIERNMLKTLLSKYSLQTDYIISKDPKNDDKFIMHIFMRNYNTVMSKPGHPKTAAYQSVMNDLELALQKANFDPDVVSGHYVDTFIDELKVLKKRGNVAAHDDTRHTLSDDEKRLLIGENFFNLFQMFCKPAVLQVL